MAGDGGESGGIRESGVRGERQKREARSEKPEGIVLLLSQGGRKKGADTNSQSRFSVAVIIALGCVCLCGCDRHVTVTKAMTWACDAGFHDPQAPELEMLRLRFVENPKYEEDVAGPHLCSAVKGPVVDATFDVWGNSAMGLHGYNPIALSERGRALPVFGWGGPNEGFHDDEPHWGNYQSRPSPFPLDVFGTSSRSEKPEARSEKKYGGLKPAAAR